MRARKPRLRTGPSSPYAGPKEIIREFSHDGVGGLLSIRRLADRRLLVEVYRADPEVIVRGPICRDDFTEAYEAMTTPNDALAVMFRDEIEPRAGFLRSLGLTDEAAELMARWEKLQGGSDGEAEAEAGR